MLHLLRGSDGAVPTGFFKHFSVYWKIFSLTQVHQLGAFGELEFTEMILSCWMLL